MSAPRAASAAGAVGLFTPGLACGSADALVGPSRTPVLARVAAPAGKVAGKPREAVRSRASALAVASRPAGARVGPFRHGDPRTAAQRNDARRSVPRLAEKRPPKAAPEPSTGVLFSFYACNSAAPADLAAGTGWRLIGPLRQS